MGTCKKVSRLLGDQEQPTVETLRAVPEDQLFRSLYKQFIHCSLQCWQLFLFLKALGRCVRGVRSIYCHLTLFQRVLTDQHTPRKFWHCWANAPRSRVPVGPHHLQHFFTGWLRENQKVLCWNLLNFLLISASFLLSWFWYCFLREMPDPSDLLKSIGTEQNKFCCLEDILPSNQP